MLDLLQPAVRSLRYTRELSEPTYDVSAAARSLSDQLFHLAREADEAATPHHPSLLALHASGLPLALFEREHGGQDLLDPGNTDALVAVLRLVGAGDLSVARLFEGHVNAVLLVSRYGTARQAAALAAAVRDGGLSAVWNAEGRRPLAATRDGDRWLLAGDKILASGAGVVSHPVITPSTGEGRIMLVAQDIGSERADLSAWTPLGMRSSATGTVEFDGTIVPRSSQIGAAGDYLLQPVFSGGAWRFCAVHLGAAERLLDLFRAHLIQRGRAGDPYQKQRVAAATAACVTARFWIATTASKLAAENDTPDSIVALANLTRMVTERACLDVLEAVQRGVGLGGFMRPDPIERVARDLATYLRQPVPDAAMADAAQTILAGDVSTHDLWAV